MKSILPTFLLAAALGAPAAASAETVAPDPEAQEVTALDATIVWVSGSGEQTLMRRTPDGEIAPLDAPKAVRYRNVDLGRDQDGKLLLTYARCATPAKCVHVWDDLDGRRATFRNLALKNCTLATTPSRWRTRVVYGLECFKRVDGSKVADNARSGLYVRSGTGRPVRLATPRAARKAGAHSVTSVDIRGTNVSAIYADISAFAVLRGVNPSSPVRTLAVGSSEGETDQRATGLAMAGTTTYFALTQSSYGGEPAQSIIRRQTAQCDDYQVLTAPPGPTAYQDHPVLDIAADGRSVFVVTPRVGITTHEYEPDVGC